MASCRNKSFFRVLPKAFSLVELQITLIVLTTGLLGLTAILRVHLRQMRAVESWYSDNLTYYIVSQDSLWMRQLDAPAELHSQPGRTAWTPPVEQSDNYRLQIESLIRDTAAQEISATVRLERIDD